MKLLKSEVIVPASLDADARGRLVEELYRVHVEIFDGVDRERFAAYVVESRAERTEILVHRNEAGEIVGYFAGHEFHRVLHGRPCVVIRGEAGMLRAYRGHGSNLRFGFTEAARLALSRTRRPVYYLGCLVHPSSYYQLAKYVRPVWPSREAQPDDATRAFMAELAELFGMASVGDDPLVRHVGWKTRDSEAERAYWRRCQRPEIRFFVESNPGYAEGHGLLTLIPMTAASISGATARIVGERVSRGAAAVRDGVRRLPVLARWLEPAEIARRLRSVQLFAGLTDAQVAALARRAHVERVPAGRVLFARGDIGGDLFVVDSGAVHVTAPGPDGQVSVLDQLDPGDVFGEIAALTGDARSATVVTATRTALIRLERPALLAAMEQDAALRDALWTRYSEHRFEDATSGMVGFAGTTREARRAHLHLGTASVLAAGAEETWSGSGYVFVAHGEVEVEQGATRLRGRAPVLLAVAGEARVVARTAARVVRVPAMRPSPEEVRLFRAHPLLARLTDAAFAAIFAAAQPVRVLAGQVLFAEGDAADAFYLVRAGAVEIDVDGAVVAKLGAGECFGERGFDPAQGERRTAGARAATATELLRVPGRVFAGVVAPQLFAAATSERVRDELAGLLAAAWADAPASAAEVRRIPAGEVVVREGDPGDAAWFVLEGLLQVERGGAIVDRIGPGECFGERALLMHTPRTATIRAQTPVVAQRIGEQGFLAWTAGHPRLRDLLATLSHVHGGRGGATTVRRGEYEGRACVTSTTRLADGRLFTATKLLEQDVLLLAADDGQGPATARVDYMRAPPGTRRRLDHRDGRALSVLLAGDLGSAAACAERLRGGRALTGGELERFRWTGELGAAGRGPQRLLCGCVGLTRGELATLEAGGCRRVEAVRERTGAGSVCGGCVPLIRRLLADPGAEAPRAADEVDLDGLEARLDELRHADGSRSLVEPDAVMWRVFGESVAVLGGARALLMQFAHPLVQGLVEHSSFLTAPGDRFHRTLRSMYGLSFGDGATLLRMAREIHEKHARVVGRYAETIGPYRAGDRYSANQLPLLLWVSATVIDTSVHTHEALIGPLTLAEKDRLIAEAARFSGLFGIPADRYPADWLAFRAYVDGVLASDAIRVGEPARTLARAVLTAPTPQGGPTFAVLRRMTARWLPPGLRTAYGMDEGPIARATGAAIERAIRAAVPRMPPALRTCPARLHAERRLRGEAGPDPDGVRLERLLAFALGST